MLITGRIPPCSEEKPLEPVNEEKTETSNGHNNEKRNSDRDSRSASKVGTFGSARIATKIVGWAREVKAETAKLREKGIAADTAVDFSGIESSADAVIAAVEGNYGEALWSAAGLLIGKFKAAGKVVERATQGIRTPKEAGFVREFVTEIEQVYYRVFSGNRTQGSFLTAVPPKSSAYAKEALALPRTNEANLIQKVVVPPNTTLRRSRAAPIKADDTFPDRRGGAEQFELIDRLPKTNFGKGSEFK